MSDLPAPDPFVQDDALPYWEAAKDGRLSVPRCDACSSIIWYPRGYCPHCGTFAVTWIDLPGTGVIYSFSVARRGQGAYRDAAPFVLAYVELDTEGPAPGPRVMTNIVDADVDAIEIGNAVTVVFDETAGGWALPRFRPVD